MSLAFQEYPFDLSDLREWLTESMPLVEAAESAPSENALELIGPFPAYYLDAREFATSGTKTASRTGWRALIQRDNEPVAILEISFSTGGQPRYATRGSDPARAFARALRTVAETELNGTYDVRWLSLADIYLTVLWLSGDDERFVPTRLGGLERAQPRLMDDNELRPIIVALIEQSRSRRRPGNFWESLTNRYSASPRSGLPDE